MFSERHALEARVACEGAPFLHTKSILRGVEIVKIRAEARRADSLKRRCGAFRDCAKERFCAPDRMRWIRNGAQENTGRAQYAGAFRDDETGSVDVLE